MRSVLRVLPSPLLVYVPIRPKTPTCTRQSSAVLNVGIVNQTATGTAANAFGPFGMAQRAALLQEPYICAQHHSPSSTDTSTEL